ncbi:MAG: tetratricopeptide repeat protein, partial [Planctomycetota bacterium]
MATENERVFYNYDLLIKQSQADSYSAVLINEGGKEVGISNFILPDEVKLFTKQFAKLTSISPKTAPTLFSITENSGLSLYNVVLTGKIRREIDRILEVGGTISLRLRVEPSELVYLPWESMHNGEKFIAANDHIVFYRTQSNEIQKNSLPLDIVPKVLCVIVRQPDHEANRMGRSAAEALNEILLPFVEEGLLQLEIAETKGAEDMQKLFISGEFHAVHLIIDSEDKDIIITEQEMLYIDEMASLLLKIKNLRFAAIVPQSLRLDCAPYLANRLVKNKLSSALSVEFPLDLHAEEMLLTSVYNGVSRGIRLDFSVAEAREKILYDLPGKVDFMIPLFFANNPLAFMPSDTWKREKAAKEAKLAHIGAQASTDKRGLVAAKTAYAHQQEGDFFAAVESYKKAIQAFEEEKDEYNLAVTLNNIGTTLIEMGEINQAIIYLEKCLVVRKKLQATAEAIVALNKLGYCYQKNNQFDNAIRSYHEALDISLKLNNDKLVCDAYYNIGRIYRRIGKREFALEMMQKSLFAARELNDTLRVQDALAYIGTLHLDLEK